MLSNTYVPNDSHAFLVTLDRKMCWANYGRCWGDKGELNLIAKQKSYQEWLLEFCPPNNYFKCMLDAITDSQLVWLDDNVTCERVQRIYYDTENPRVELDIFPVNYIGIFDNVSHLNQFENKCVGCKRYERNCSLLQKAKEGKIQKDIK